MGRGYDKFLSVLLVLLTVTVLGGAGYLVYKACQKYITNNDSDSFLANEFENYVKDVDNNHNQDEYDEANAINEQVPDSGGVRGIKTEALKYKGYNVEGRLEMPSVKLQYPVLEQMTNANELEVSVAIQYGVGLNKVGNTVIIGHNYRSGLFFGSNKKMNVGDSVFITDTATGTRVEYKIYNKYTTEESDTGFYNRDTNGKREVSLVTCQTNNKYRLVILAREV